MPGSCHALWGHYSATTEGCPLRTPTPTHLNTFVRDAASWPKHRKDKKARKRERKTIAREAQKAKDARLFMNPNR